jgi:hypothetical protein
MPSCAASIRYAAARTFGGAGEVITPMPAFRMSSVRESS